MSAEGSRGLCQHLRSPRELPVVWKKDTLNFLSRELVQVQMQLPLVLLQFNTTKPINLLFLT